MLKILFDRAILFLFKIATDYCGETGNRRPEKEYFKILLSYFVCSAIFQKWDKNEQIYPIIPILLKAAGYSLKKPIVLNTNPYLLIFLEKWDRG